MPGKLQGPLDLCEPHLDAMTLHLIEPGAQGIASDSMALAVLNMWERRSHARLAYFA